jgi:hypothetical protein
LTPVMAARLRIRVAGNASSYKLVVVQRRLLLLSPASGRGWERGLQAAFETPSPNLSP